MTTDDVRRRWAILEALRSRTHRAGQVIVFFISLVMFICSITVLVYGFIGYYSRVALISEFKNEEKNIDYVFMRVDQIETDEADLKSRKQELNRLESSTNALVIETKTAAYGSKEYKNYLNAASIPAKFLYDTRQILSEAYWTKINQIDYGEPNLSQAQLFANPEYRPNTSSKQQSQLYSQLAPAIQDFRFMIITYDSQFGNQMDQIRNVNKTNSESLRAAILAILTRNPQWAMPDDIKSYGLAKVAVDPAEQKATAQQRAILRSYKSALGWASGILQWPTIVSTLVVTIAAGWLGGTVSFMGAAIRSRGSAEENAIKRNEPEIISLIRRAILGITAAVGIFLFAGSGLLVLTAQTEKLASSGSIELSPYFVAFLAFISGFLADEAFARMTRAGDSIFQTEDTAQGGKPQPRPQDIKPAVQDRNGASQTEHQEDTPQAPGQGPTPRIDNNKPD